MAESKHLTQAGKSIFSQEKTFMYSKEDQHKMIQDPLKFASKFAQAFTSAPVRTALLLGAGAVLAFAQTSSFGTAAQGVATEVIAIAKWIGIILCIFCGFGLMVGGPGAIAKASGLFIGLIFALFASPIITWVQNL